MDGINHPKLDVYWFPIENKKLNLDDFSMVCNNHPILDDYRLSKIIHIWNRTIPVCYFAVTVHCGVAWKCMQRYYSRS